MRCIYLKPPVTVRIIKCFSAALWPSEKCISKCTTKLPSKYLRLNSRMVLAWSLHKAVSSMSFNRVLENFNEGKAGNGKDHERRSAQGRIVYRSDFDVYCQYWFRCSCGHKWQITLNLSAQPSLLWVPNSLKFFFNRGEMNIRFNTEMTWKVYKWGCSSLKHVYWVNQLSNNWWISPKERCECEKQNASRIFAYCFLS